VVQEAAKNASASREEAMRRTFLLGCGTLLAGLAAATGDDGARQQNTDVAAIRSANAAFYAALSTRDIGAVERLWARQGPVFNIFAASSVPLADWSAIRAGYEELFARFPELSVTMAEPQVAQNGDGALVVGVETLRARLPNGEARNLSLPTTNVFIHRNGRWLMMHHHSSRPF
jgi:ketosteroid isomerase-like protein